MTQIPLFVNTEQFVHVVSVSLTYRIFKRFIDNDNTFLHYIGTASWNEQWEYVVFLHEF